MEAVSVHPACNHVLLLLQVGIPLSQLLYSTDPFTTYLTCATTLANGTMRDGDLLPGATPLYSSAYLASSSGIAPRVCTLLLPLLPNPNPILTPTLTLTLALTPTQP